MPYRSLTHGRVRGAQSPPVNAHTNQVKAIEFKKELVIVVLLEKIIIILDNQQ